MRLSHPRCVALGAALCAAALTSIPARAELGDGAVPRRKTTRADLDVPVERYVLPNGLVVLLAPDPDAGEVLVDLGFRAGTLHEPPGLNGLAHFVEHMLVTGTSSVTDYVTLLESAGARGLNAFTRPKSMVFRVIVPPEAVELALWVNADRLGTLPRTWTEPELEHHRRVVEVERIQRNVDVHFGAVDALIMSRVFPENHPLHKGVAGHPAALAKARLADVQAFVTRNVSPGNGALVVVGAFDPKTIRGQIQRTLGALPRSTAAPRRPPNQMDPALGNKLAVKERRSRRPRVSYVWRLPGLGEEQAAALTLGAMLIQAYIDGAFGTSVDAGVETFPGGAVFRLDLTLPYDKPLDAAEQEAEALLRYLTSVDMPRDVFEATRVMTDRLTLRALDELEGRARFIEIAELQLGDGSQVGAYLSRFWRYSRQDVHHIAWKSLKTGPPRLVVHGRPVRPLQPKLDWEDRMTIDGEER